MNELPKSVRDELALQQQSGAAHPDADLLRRAVNAKVRHVTRDEARRLNQWDTRYPFPGFDPKEGSITLDLYSED